MAGNYRPDLSGDIYVEFDYNNLIVVDPNKTVDDFGNINERLVDHENLVMYANLEAEVLPRTKLAVGVSTNDRIETVSIAKINFLKPTKENYLGTGYYDELTGKDSTKFKGDNQSLELTKTTSIGNDYIKNTVVDESNIIDNGLLGITSIRITTNTSFVPTIQIELEDVQGRALFQLGGNSPYSAFFNLPYPQFYLTLKGYYGQAVKYQLNLEKFTSRYNSFSGNYQITLQFKGYKFNILNEISMGHLLAAPHMYSQTFTTTTQLDNNSNVVTQVTTEKGYEKIRQVYAEYKTKGLIPNDLPELTLVQLMNNLENFENFIVNSYPKSNLEPLSNIRNYKELLVQFYDKVISSPTSWYNRYIDPRPLVTKNKLNIFVFKKNLDASAITEAYNELNNIIVTYNKLLSDNPTLGKNGSQPIKNTITINTLTIDVINTQIDWELTALNQVGAINNNTINDIKSSYNTLYLFNSELKKNIFYIFDGDNRFTNLMNNIEAQANKKLSEYETIISADLARRLENSDSGIGFKPTVRNILSVIMASAEGFIRLLDDVHTKAWDIKYDPIRKRAILDNPSSAPSSDSVDKLSLSVNSQFLNSGLNESQIPVYPWPQFFVETPDDKKGRFQLKYIGDPSVVDLTQGAIYSKWPEVEFVEEYMRGLTQKFNPPIAPPPLENQKDTDQVIVNAIEYPSFGLSYFNKEEIKFFYEIWERQFLTANYSGYIRLIGGNLENLIKLVVDSEIENIKRSLGISSPYLTFKLKNYDLSGDYVEYLNNISNMGTGKSYQEFIRDFFVTPYINSYIDNSFTLLQVNDIGKVPLYSVKSDALSKIVESPNNTPTIMDTLPFTDSSWVTNNMAGVSDMQNNSVYNTNKTLKVFQDKNVISNFEDVNDFVTNRPVTNFKYLSVGDETNDTFSRDYVPTVGEYVNVVNNQLLNETYVTSMLNTPYFVNAIQLGVQKQKEGVDYPYIQASYLFLNSLPIGTLKEKYKTYTNGVTEDLDYISSVFKKYGAIHKMPYAWVLKLGSIWYRYKTYIDTNVDILDDVWKDFDYVSNYSPIQKSVSQEYSFDYNQVNETIILEDVKTDSIVMNVGFYPKVINDFNYFYNGFDLYTNYTNDEIQKSVNIGLKINNFSDSNILGVNQNDVTLSEKTWSVLLPEYGVSVSVNSPSQVVTNNVTHYVVPSFGTKNNSVKDFCISNNSTLLNLTGNNSLYNGSIRCLWNQPNYGYFNSNQNVKPNYDEYVNLFDVGQNQSPFRFLGVKNYSKIEEIFSVFDRKVLDLCSNEFLSFSKESTDISDVFNFQSFNTSNVNLNSVYRNFQSLFKNIMTVSSKYDTDETIFFNNVLTEQFLNFGNEVKGFMEYDVILKDGNPQNYNRRIFDSYLSYKSTTPRVVDPIPFNPYIKNTLPSKSGGISLQESKLLNPSAWNALLTDVGFSTIENVKYADNGSYITDFFIDNDIEFSRENVQILSQIIKIYATQKLKNQTSTYNVNNFKSELTQYLTSTNDFQNIILNRILSGLNKTLPNINQLPERVINSVVSGEQSKVELYEVFKALNDKWISGSNFSDRTLYEDMLFLDRASRNIGDLILLDIFDLKNMFNEKSLNQAMSVFTFISGILIKNNFTVMNLPAYVNFYNVQNIDGTRIPNGGGSLEFANNMWGTFLNVDYSKSTPKMICFFVGKPSSYLDLPKGNFRFRNDGFEMRRSSENPLLENQTGKTDWELSNKCVGFNVDIGTRNQNIFYSFSVEQNPGVATSESINTMLNMVDQSNGKNTSTQNVSLYNLYKQRSYQCSISSLGNAMIQPMMYFNLRHVPMFNGPYMILSVEHVISPGSFQTQFTGVRQGIFDLPAIDNFIQQINQNLLTRLESIVKVDKDGLPNLNTTENSKSSNVIQSADNTKSTPNSCVNKLDPYYSSQKYDRAYIVNDAVLTKLTPKELSKALKDKFPSNPSLRVIIYCISYIRTYQSNNNNQTGMFYGYNHNYSTIPLNQRITPDRFFLRTYSCVNLSSNNSQPIANFDSLNSYLDFMESKITPNIDRILQLGLNKYYVCYWPTNNVSESYYDQNIDEFNVSKNSFYLGLNSAILSDVITVDEGKTIGIF